MPMHPVRDSRHPNRKSGAENPGWETHWGRLGRALRIAPDEGLLVALSGGADSIFLLHILAAARPHVRIHAVHVDHGLRGIESSSDANFCAQICAELGVPLTIRELTLAPEGPSLEARARQARYRCLVEEAVRTGHRIIVTGHHSDDALETVLMRWVRGSSLAGLRGPKREWRPSADEPDVRVVRPLLAMRREEVRALLQQRGLAWREDSSNRDGRFTRNRMRNEFLPLLERLGGAEGIQNLRAFGNAVENLEDQFARATAHLAWKPAPYVRASREPARRQLGGMLERGTLMALSRPLRRRALWRLLLEGSGHAPSDDHLAFCLDALASARTTRLNLRGGWQLVFRAAELHLLPPRACAASTKQVSIPMGLDVGRPDVRPLALPGHADLGDGRRVTAERLSSDPGRPVPRDGWSIEIDARNLPPGPLEVRCVQPGDRFHPLGSPGKKPLRRYLADKGIPREERARIPLVFAGKELVWVCGYAPCEAHRVTQDTRERLRLTLRDGASLPPEEPH